MTFGEKLKKLRNDNNLTQDELAERIYVTRTAISKWETDKGYPRHKKGSGEVAVYNKTYVFLT